MTQITQKYSYRFPNAWLVFVAFLGLPLVFFALLLRKFVAVVGARGDVSELGPALIGLAIACLIAVSFATIIANAFPDVTVDALGIYVRFFLPFFTRWIHLPWSSIAKVTSQDELVIRLLKDRRPNLAVFSTALPTFYHIPTAWFAFSPQRGFLVTKQIQGYSELARLLISARKPS